jgi:hypothetical protein
MELCAYLPVELQSTELQISPYAEELPEELQQLLLPIFISARPAVKDTETVGS